MGIYLCNSLEYIDADYMNKEIISHIRQADFSIQTNHAHQEGVANLASIFACDFNMSEWGRLAGLLHDKGKEQNSFQQYIRKVSGLEPEVLVDGDHKHAYVGALIANKLFPWTSQIIDNIIMGHHRGLYDDDERKVVSQMKMPEDVAFPDIDIQLNRFPARGPKDVHHITRMLFSCLVDADYLDTEHFMMPEQSMLRGGKSSVEELLSRLERYLDNLNRDAADTEVNRIRNEVQEYCRKASDKPADFYSLTVPTGGGKTLSSMLWALLHAKRNSLKRIIIAIPYTSIITQTAAILRNIFGDENVLEHHSNVNFKDWDECSQRLKLATENWDYPIIVTTNVQLFESLFSNKPSDCRKLHNIVKSVLILDEVQTLPIEYLRPVVDTLDTLKRIFNVSVLFTTASLPVLSGKIEGTNPFVSFDALPQIKEIVPEGANLHDRLRRVKLDIDNTKQSFDDVANKISKHPRVLCIVNTRKDAKEIYSRLPKEGFCFHISRMMCPAHVRKVIDEIKQALQNDSNTIIRVIATQLIEAGVDVDFPVVFRQEAGLDSILQAAGRCNREGKSDMCTTYVFSLQNMLPSGFITQTNNARLAMAGDHDWFSPEAMIEYFKQLHSRMETFDKAQINQLLYQRSMQFETAANDFHLIDENTTSIIVNWKDSALLVDELCSEGFSYSLMKKLAQYSVNVRDRDLKKLYEAGAVEELLEGVLFIRDTSFYDDNIGLNTENHWLEESLIK